MAGKAIDFDSPVRYGILGEPVLEKNTWKGNGPAPQLTGGPPNALQQKMQRLQQGLRRLAQTGGDPRPVQREIMKFQRLMQQGQHSEAEQHLDRAMAMIQPGPRPLPKELEDKLNRIRTEVERLMREGKKAEASRLLDGLLRRSREP